jgi:hypothetical protein
MSHGSMRVVGLKCKRKISLAQLGSRVPKSHAYDSAAMADKRRTSLTSATVADKGRRKVPAGCYSAIFNHHRLLATFVRGYNDDVT